MPGFFIERPIFAWVVALLICLGGLLAIPFLAVAQYPMIAPPSISVSTSYPGASPENLYNSVTRLIEEELNGANGILNFELTSDSLGQVDIIANFVPGTNTESASVEVQNRIKRVEARLPRAVIQQGILIDEASSAVLQIITLRSTDGSLDEVGLGDFMVRNILGEIRRIPGVGRATLYSTERALRIWIDPRRLVGFNLTADDVTKAITAQNAQVASGSIGVEPSSPNQQISAMVLVKGQFVAPDEFGSIVLRANADGSTVRLRDVARIEVGGMSYQFTTRQNGQATAGLSVLLAPGANALATANAVKAKMAALSNFFPATVKYDIPYDITPVVVASIQKVLVTLAEAVVLVFLVMLLFLQNIRYTLIPTIVVPVALLGTCATLLLHGPLDQHADAVRHGSGHRHPGRRCDRGGRERRTHHVRGRAVAQGGHAQGDEADHRRHRRHHAGPDVRVRADGVLSRLGWHHLPAVLDHHDRGDRIFRAAGADAHPCAVRDHAQAGRRRSSSSRRAAYSAGSTAAWSRPRTAMAGWCNGRSCGPAGSCSSTPSCSPA